MNSPEPLQTDINFEDYTLLIVDDNPTNLAVISDYLKLFGFHITVARDGKSGLKRAAYVQPDLILLDVMMPGLNGFEVCQRLKAIDELRDIPVIFMTTLAGTEDKVKGFSVGAVDYVTKPFQHEEVLARVTTHLKIRDLTRNLAEKVHELAQLNDNLKTTQNQLVESEKMAALGGLVAGVAHEINTPVGVAITAASAFVEEMTSLSKTYHNDEMGQEEFEEFLDVGGQYSRLILSNLGRAADLIRSFKQVAVDQSSGNKRKFAVKSYLEEILISLKPKLKRNKHQVEINCDENLILDSHPGAWSQIVTNLVMNSIIHGYKQDEQGQLMFDIQANNGQLNFVYQDDGQGIPSKNLSKVFDPFFTTRLGEGGSGLGLHIIYNLVTQRLGGAIRCESEASQGTRFIIELPLDGNRSPPP